MCFDYREKRSMEVENGPIWAPPGPNQVVRLEQGALRQKIMKVLIYF